MNVLLLTADSLRADRTSLFGHHRDTTPFLSELADRSFEFRRAYTNGRNTAAAFPAIHTSRFASHYEGLGIPDEGTPTLAEALRESGYSTHAIHTNELVSRDYNYDRGFDDYLDSRGNEESDSSGWRGTARKLIGDGLLFEAVKQAHFLSTEYLGVKIFDTADAVSGFEDSIVEWATDAENDWFVWAHYMNPHHPYEPPEECQEALGLDPIPARKATKLSRKMRLHPEDVTPDERETLQGLYDASVLSWDREIESTYQALEDRGLLEDTLVVVTADHGELLGEDGIYGHPPVLNQELLHVPLLFSGGPIEAGATENQVGLVDLAPTILSITGNDVPEEYHGQPLLSDDGSPREFDPVRQFAETGDDESPRTCAIDGTRKLVHDASAGTWTAYTLDEMGLHEEPSEESYDDLREAIEQHEATAARNRQRGAEVDEARLEEDLAALGYLDES